MKFAKEDQALTEIEALIRSGEFTHAKSSLLKIKVTRRMPPEHRVRFANLARRLGLPNVSLRALARFVRPDANSPLKATPAEVAEYAASLIRVGGVSEAHWLLDTLNPRENIEALLFKSFAYFSQWDYASAIPLLRNYLTSASLTPYQRAVGPANLLAALVYEKNSDAETEIQQQLIETEEARNNLLFVNALISLVEKRIVETNWDEATALLQKAAKLTDGHSSLEGLFVEKWEALLQAYRQGGAPSTLRPVELVRKKALLMKHWETIRNCDLHEGLLTKNTELLAKVYYGTPYASLRQKIVNEAKPFFKPEPFYEWQLFGNKGRAVPHEINLSTHGGLSEIGLKTGSQSALLLMLFTTDFYRPLRLATIFSAIHSQEIFNPFTSPVRIYQSISRLNRDFKELKLPLSIEGGEHGYAMTALRDCRIHIGNTSQSFDKLHAKLAAIRSVCGTDSFTAFQAARALGVSRWTAIRILREAIATGEITKVSQGTASKYAFSVTAGVKAA